MVDNIYRKNLGRRAGSITGRALSQFESRLTIPVDLAQDWVRIVDAKPGAARFVEGNVERLSRDMKSLGSAARDAIERLQDAQPIPSLANALRCALSNIAALESVFHRAGTKRADIAIGPIQALSDDLLMVPGLRVDDQGNLDESIPADKAIALMVDTEAHTKRFPLHSTSDWTKVSYRAQVPCAIEWQSKTTPAEDNCRERLEDTFRSHRRMLQGPTSSPHGEA